VRSPSEAPEGPKAPEVEIPHDIVNEQVVIAAAFVDDKARDALIALPSDLFIGDDHGEIWDAMRDLHRARTPIDVQGVATALAGKVDPSYLRELVDSYPKAPANLRTHIGALRWDHARAEVVSGPLTELLRAMQDSTARPERIRALAHAVANSLDAGADKGLLVRSSDALIREHMVELDRRRKRALYPYGIDGFDVDDRGIPRMIPGAAPKFCTVITGISGSAKSVLTARIILEQARKDRLCLYGAWEMGDGDTLELMAMMSLADDDPGKWGRHKVSTGDLDEGERDELRDRMEAIAAKVKFFPVPFKGQRTRKRSNDDALDIIHQAIADSGCEVWALDLWERAFPDRKPEAEANALFRTQEIAQITRTHGILVAQQRLKDIEQRDDKRPTREGIKGSGAWVEVGDTIIGAHRPALFSNAPDTEICLLGLKQRWGRWPFEIRCDWDGDRGQISNGREVDHAAGVTTGKRARSVDGIGGRA